MAGTRMDGAAVAASVRAAVGAEVSEMRAGGTEPCLATVLVGDDEASAAYVRNKHRACAEAGILTRDHRLGAGASQGELGSLVGDLNSDPAVHGILVQLPLPGHLDEFACVSGISPAKDVDGLTPHNAGLLAAGRASLGPGPPAGVLGLLDHYGVELAGRHAVVINRSRLVGRPLHHLLLGRDATVTTCHSRTEGLAGLCRGADVVVTAVGDRSRFTLTGDMVREGAAVVDVAVSRHGGRLAGDADYDGVMRRAALVSPVPGGVGPMTVAMLLRNTAIAARGRDAGRP